MMPLITEKVVKLTVTEGEKKKRIDTFLANVLENTSRSRIQNLIKNQLVTANNNIVKASYLIEPGDIIELKIPIKPRPDKIEPENIPLNIVYEDEHLIVLNKPAGLVVHPSPGNYTGTLVHALKYYTDELSESNGEIRSGIVHRIDKGTSGLLLIAKSEDAHGFLAKQFADHSIEREYWAVCWGKLKDSKGEISGNIARSRKDRKTFSVSDIEGKEAYTYYEVLEEFDFLSLLKLKLRTGRTHQIRVHLAHIRHNVFGDPTYGGRRINYGFEYPKIQSHVNNLLKIINRQALHAKTIGFVHPYSKEKMHFNSDLPEDMEQLLNSIRNF
jgi:23S rRNA pseudouridine1911/1915/1917 synthase